MGIIELVSQFHQVLPFLFGDNPIWLLLDLSLKVNEAINFKVICF
jgi:hypothetical protein